jgi:hypothetical protein
MVQEVTKRMLDRCKDCHTETDAKEGFGLELLGLLASGIPSLLPASGTTFVELI